MVQAAQAASVGLVESVVLAVQVNGSITQRIEAEHPTVTVLPPTGLAEIHEALPLRIDRARPATK